MSAIAPTRQAFCTDRLIRQRHASDHTIAAYRDTMRLLLHYVTARTGVPPSRPDIDELDAPMIRVPGPPRTGAREQRPHPQR